MEQTRGCGFCIAVLQYPVWVMVVAVLHQLDVGVCLNWFGFLLPERLELVQCPLHSLQMHFGPVGLFLWCPAEELWGESSDSRKIWKYRKPIAEGVM